MSAEATDVTVPGAAMGPQKKPTTEDASAEATTRKGQESREVPHQTRPRARTWNADCSKPEIASTRNVDSTMPCDTPSYIHVSQYRFLAQHPTIRCRRRVSSFGILCPPLQALSELDYSTSPPVKPSSNQTHTSPQHQSRHPPLQSTLITPAANHLTEEFRTVQIPARVFT